MLNTEETVAVSDKKKFSFYMKQMMNWNECSIRQLPFLLLRLAMFVINGVMLNVASFLFLLGAVILCCPFSPLLPNLLLFDMLGLQSLGLGKLLNKQTVDLSQDLVFLASRFPREVQNVGIVLCLFAIILYMISIVGCYSAIMKSRRSTEYYTMACGLSLVSLAILSINFFSHPMQENELTNRIRCFVWNRYPKYQPQAEMDGNIVDFFQSRFGCCGIHNGSEYVEQGILPKIPTSCCKLYRLSLRNGFVFLQQSPTCRISPNVYNSNIMTGCFDLLFAYVRNMMGRSVLVLWVMCFIGVISWMTLRWLPEKTSEKECVKMSV